MLQKKWRMVKLAALVVLGLCCGLALRSAEKPAEKKGEDAPPPIDKGAELVQDRATVNSLIEFGRKHQDPLPLLTAAKMLFFIGEPKDTLPTEGEAVATTSTMKEQVQDLVNEARKLKSANNDVIKKLATQVEDLVGEGRGAVNGSGKKWRGIVPGKYSYPVSVKFVAKPKTGSLATICVYKPSNGKGKGVPLDYVTVYDPAGKVVPPTPGKNNSGWAFYVVGTVDVHYNIVINNRYTDAVEVEVDTN